MTSDLREKAQRSAEYRRTNATPIESGLIAAKLTKTGQWRLRQPCNVYPDCGAQPAQWCEGRKGTIHEGRGGTPPEES